MSYSQNREDIFVLDYFGKQPGVLLEVGANDGSTLSNSRLLIEHGWEAHLLEPGSVCGALKDLHKGNDRVHIYNYGIGTKEEVVKFYESGAHVRNGNDIGLVSTTVASETERWRKSGVQFTPTVIQLVPYKKFVAHSGCGKFDFISIDAEGMDWDILRQIDLNKAGCKCLCIEWNGDAKLREQFTRYADKFGMLLLVVNAENLIFVR